MAVNFLLKRSNTASKRPTAAQLDIGELSLNYESTTPGLFFEDSAGGVRKIGPVEVSASAPNSSPAGSTGNSTGELWFDTGTNNLKIWTGAAFAEARASVATLTTTRTIWGQNFNGSANVSGALSGATTISASSDISLGGELNFTTASAKYVDFYTDNDAGVLSAANLRLVNNASNSFHNAIVMQRGGAVTLYHNNSSKLATSANGVDITGTLTVTSSTLVTNLNADSVDGKSFGTFTAAGGVLYATSTTAASGTAAGTAGQALLSAGASAPVWTTLTLENLPDAAFKRSVRAATTADVGASTFAAGVLTGFDDVVVLNVSTTLSSTTATTTSTAGLKPGAVISGNANIPAATTIASITNATTFVMSAAATATAASISTTFTQTIAALAVDGITLALNNRVLVKNQASTLQNGIYYLSTLGSTTVPWVLTRALDADTSSELGGGTVNVDSGTTHGGQLWTTSFKTTDTLNTTAMNWYLIIDTSSANSTAATIAMNGVQAAGSSNLYARADHVHPSDTSRAPLASPTFTGTPAAPTAAADTNTTQLATTAFVVGQASATNPLALGTVAIGTSLRYARQDHVHPTTGLGLTSGTLAQFAATSSSQLAGVISDETGSGALVFATSPTLVTPVLGTPTSGNLSNCTNVPAGQLSGTIPSGVLGNSSLFIGTTSIALNRASAAIALTGITSIDGDAASVDGKSFGTFTAAGGILYATSTTAASATAAGTAGQFVKSAGASAPTWATLEMTDIPGAAYKKSVRAATTADLGTVTATSTTLTNAGTLAAFPAQDGVTLVQNDRVLVKNQTSAAQNGIYTLTTVGSISVAWVLTRAADADTSAEIGAAVVAIDEGTANAGELWTTTFKATDTIGTTAMNWFEVVYNSGTWAISTTGSAATLTTTRTIWGQNFNGGANVTGSLTSVGNITGSGAVTLSSAAASALNLNSGTTGAVALDSGSTGAVNIGNNANAKTITIGNVTGATTINVNSGTGGILVTSPHLTMANQGEVRFREATGGGTNYIGLEAPAAVAADLTFILPGSDATTSTGYTLKSNGSAALSFGTANVLTSDSAVASPLDGDLWYNSADGRLYVYYADANTNQWVDVSPVSAGVTNIRILDSIAASFNGTTATFNLTVSSVAVSPVNAQQLLIVVGGIVQAAGTHYTISGSTITFTAGNIPAAGLTFYGVIYGAAVTQNTVADNSITTTKIQNGAVTPAKLSINASVLPTADNAYDLGSASFRFANVYTGDLHLKNDRGDWTIIEEEDCLTMRNNKTGKVYDIMMKERNAQ